MRKVSKMFGGAIGGILTQALIQLLKGKLPSAGPIIDVIVPLIFTGLGSGAGAYIAPKNQ